MDTDIKPASMPCYPVPDDCLRDALAGRLLTGPAESKPDRDSRDWLYCDGLAAGVRWAVALATAAELDRLDADQRQGWLVAASWLRGFINGALAQSHDSSR